MIPVKHNSVISICVHIVFPDAPAGGRGWGKLAPEAMVVRP
jgi:hypothetical protein